MRATRWICLLAFVASRIWALHAYPVLAEDGYIVAGWANRFTHGIVSHGLTSSIWGMASAIGPLLSIPAHVWMRGMGIAVEIAALWWASGSLSTTQFAALTAILSAPFFGRLATSGLEAPFCVAAVLVASRSRWGWAWLAAMRPDTALIAMICNPRMGLVGAVIQLGCNLIALHELIPSTMIAKSIVYGGNMFAGWGWVDWLRPGIHSSVVLASFCGLNLAPALGILAWVAVMFSASAPLFWWYLAAPKAVLAVAASRFSQSIPLAVAVSACAILGYSVEHAWNAKNISREDAFRIVAGKIDGGKTILLEPAGVIPYLNPRLEVIDEVGLITPWVARMRKENPVWWTKIVLERNPDWIVTRARITENDLIPIAFTGVNAQLDKDLLIRLYDPIVGAESGPNTAVALWRRKSK